jgi:two-component system, OmpR family, KDP operon response regulator KdpE
MPEQSETVLVVDDEAAIVRALTAALEARGYRVVSTATGIEALDRVAADGPAIVILDLGLPDMDGIDVCRRIRQWSQIPIIVLTAEGADDRKVTALDEGADDYVTKPFSVPELLARVRVALRHRTRAGGVLDESVYTVGDIVIDVARRTVTADGRAVDLTPKEFGFLAALARHPGRVISHRMILEEVWGKGYGTETQYLRVYASQLRKKLREDPTRPRLITEPGVGYRLVDRSDE